MPTVSDPGGLVAAADVLALPSAQDSAIDAQITTILAAYDTISTALAAIVAGPIADQRALCDTAAGVCSSLRAASGNAYAFVSSARPMGEAYPRARLQAALASHGIAAGAPRVGVWLGRF